LGECLLYVNIRLKPLQTGWETIVFLLSRQAASPRRAEQTHALARPVLLQQYRGISIFPFYHFFYQIAIFIFPAGSPAAKYRLGVPRFPLPFCIFSPFSD